MALKNFTKDDLSNFLKRILNQTTIDDVRTEIEEIADEYNIDISEDLEPADEEPILEDIEDEDWSDATGYDDDDWDSGL